MSASARPADPSRLLRPPEPPPPKSPAKPPKPPDPPSPPEVVLGGVPCGEAEVAIAKKRRPRTKLAIFTVMIERRWY
jgi:hypothetical protein